MESEATMQVEARRGVAISLMCAVVAAALLLPLSSAQAQCIANPVQNGQTCTNTGTLTDTSTVNPGVVTNVGLQDAGAINLTNAASGVIRGTTAGGNDAAGVYAVGGTVSNFGLISSAGNWGVLLNGAAGSVFNAGTIVATGVNANGVEGLNAPNFTLTNTGVVYGARNGFAGGGTSTIIMNSGTITGGGQHGVFTGTATITNTGIIAGANSVGGNGIFMRGAINNTGTISGFVGIQTNGSAVVSTIVNSGTVIGTGGTAFLLDPFANGQPQNLTLLPGSRIVGAINMGGSAASTLNVVTGAGPSTSFTITNHTGAFNVSGSAPFVVLGNRVVSLDTTSSAIGFSGFTDMSRTISTLVPDFGVAAPSGGGTTSFAAEAPSRVHDAFASITGAASSYTALDAPLANAAMVAADGTAIWSRGFGGRSSQSADGLMLASSNTFYGGALGIEMRGTPGLKFGGYVGGGATRTVLDRTSGENTSDLGFAGAYTRLHAGASSLRFGVQGGVSRNDAKRNINNNLAPGGIETASASYSGWYFSPDAKLDHRIDLGMLSDARYVLTPSVQVRYLHASLDGYTETGSTANLTVGSRTSQSLEQRAELKLARLVQLGGGLLETSVHGGALFAQQFGGSNVSGLLLGQPIAFAVPVSANATGGYVGGGVEWRDSFKSFFGSITHQAYSQGNATFGQAGVRLLF